MPLDLSWDSFRESFLHPGLPAVHPISGSKSARLFVDAAGSRIGLWLQLRDKGSELPRTGRALAIGVVATDTGPCLEIATRVQSHFEEFYVLVGDIITRLDGGAAPEQATGEAIQSWRDLLRERARLSHEEELGLWGELWFLEFMLDNGHANALEAWTGPLGDPHDFRFGALEVEIKTSSGTRRHHTISSLEQLIPSRGSRLHLVSILVAPTSNDAGSSLRLSVNRLRAKMSGSGRALFEARLLQVGYDAEDESAFNRHFVLRVAPLSVPVDEKCPVLGRPQLERGCGPQAAIRILRAGYTIDIEGLGTDLRAAEFTTT